MLNEFLAVFTSFLALPFHVLLRYDPAHEIARKHARIFMDIIEEGKVVGDVRDNIDVRRVRDLYFGGLQRLATAWLLSGRSYSLVGMARDFSELIIHSIRTVPEMRGSTRGVLRRHREKAGDAPVERVQTAGLQLQRK